MTSGTVGRSISKVNFARVFHSLAQRFGERPALINVERGRRYTFRQLHELSNRIANLMLNRLALGAGDRYLMILQNDNLSLLHFWTILKGSAAAVFTNANDSVEEHLRQIDFVKPKCVFLESDGVAALYRPLRERGIEIVALDGGRGLSGVHDFWNLVAEAGKEEPAIEREVNDEPAFYRFTGGTTGIPKCATYAYRHVEYLWQSFTRLEDPIFSADTRFLHFTPLSHGSMFALVPTFFSGGCNVTQNRPDLAVWCENVERLEISASFLVPTLLYRILNLEEAVRRDLSSLATLVYGAAPMSPSKLVELQEKFGNVFLQVYGSTESFGIVTCLSKADHIGCDAAGRRESCGRAVAGGELIVADDDGRELLPGEIGELWHRNRGVIGGYFQNPDATAAEFANGWWKSGDLGRIDSDGYCTIVDRKKDMIISGGFNIYATEVEAALCSHPVVLMAAVVGVPHPDWGEAVHGEVVCRPNVRVAADELIAHVKRAIGSYKAPKSIVFVDQLPVSSVGKVLRKDVRAKYWQAGSRQIG
jgi:acyl-CoA synthetase (AMP-forming)/AMP-acid ligase II